MKINTMRKIDYWLGVPLCFLLSLFWRLENFWGIRKIKKKDQPQKILFIELSEMGSTVLAYSAMKKVQDFFALSQSYFLIFRENQESIKILDLIPEKNIYTISSNNFLQLILDTFRVLSLLRKENIDTIIDLELFSRFTAILSFLSGAKRRVGFYRFFNEGLYRGKLQTHNVEYNSQQHISKNFLSLVYSLKAPLNQIPLLKQEISGENITVPLIKSDEQREEKIRQKLRVINPQLTEKKKIVILNPNSSKLLPLRNWPIEKYSELAHKLLFDPDLFIVISGVISEKEEAAMICRAVSNSRCIDFTGKTTFRELIDLFNISEVMVSNDSGPPHFASLTSLNIVVIFGPETPNLYAPLSKRMKIIYSDFMCSPCVSAHNHRQSACNDNRCLKEISVDEVYAAVKDFLWQSSGKVSL